MTVFWNVLLLYTLFCLFQFNNAQPYIYGTSVNITSFSVDTFTVMYNVSDETEQILFNNIRVASYWPTIDVGDLDQIEGVLYYPVVTNGATYLFRASIEYNRPLSPILISQDANFAVINIVWSKMKGIMYLTCYESSKNVTLYLYDSFSSTLEPIVNLSAYGPSLSYGYGATAFSTGMYYTLLVTNTSATQFKTDLVSFPINNPSNFTSYTLSDMTSMGDALPFSIYYDDAYDFVVGVAKSFEKNQHVVFQVDNMGYLSVSYIVDSFNLTGSTYDSFKSVFVLSITYPDEDITTFFYNNGIY
eukprot:TRINITY_DN7110_c0_g2_i1.p1 TRINITY_DN7110_c0_g2~~TRINITY_DN7110_c0_g2_i1.p1  ORF type:complete len:302 (-),score=40.19 TRINITY_DN7110_c0_g2_i1:120-1025(-)